MLGTVLSALHIVLAVFLLTAFEIGTIFDPTLQTRKLSQVEVRDTQAGIQTQEV